MPIIKFTQRAGFTLIELSIVLVIIGLIVGGILVGRDLISAATVRAQISQIEKYQTAVNTFRGKYNALPGDMNATTAATFGFTARGTSPGQGDGNALIEGVNFLGLGNSGLLFFGGETEMFWVDLTTANGHNINLIDGGFSQNKMTAGPSSVSQSQVSLYMPQAKIGAGNYVYVWSGGWKEVMGGETSNDGLNYFGLSVVTAFGFGVSSNVSLTVRQAYDIDKKVDDGLPQSGRVMAMYVEGGYWAAGGGNTGTGSTASGDYSSTTDGPVTSVGDIGDGSAGGPPYATKNTCYDGSQGLPEQYSLSVNNGAGPNCALSFRFQ